MGRGGGGPAPPALAPAPVAVEEAAVKSLVLAAAAATSRGAAAAAAAGAVGDTTIELVGRDDGCGSAEGGAEAVGSLLSCVVELALPCSPASTAPRAAWGNAMDGKKRTGSDVALAGAAVRASLREVREGFVRVSRGRTISDDDDDNAGAPML